MYVYSLPVERTSLFSWGLYYTTLAPTSLLDHGETWDETVPDSSLRGAIWACVTPKYAYGRIYLPFYVINAML